MEVAVDSNVAADGTEDGHFETTTLWRCLGKRGEGGGAGLGSPVSQCFVTGNKLGISN